MKSKMKNTCANIIDDTFQVVKVINFESEEVPLWAKAFSQHDLSANLIFFAQPRNKRHVSWMKHKNVIARWEYSNLISIRKNGDVVFTWRSEQEYIAFLLKWM